MKNLLVLSIIYLIGISLLLIFNELTYRRLGPKGEVTRKFAHFSSVLATIPFPYIFPSHWYVLVFALLFAIVLFLTQHSKLLGSIHDIGRKSVGSYLLPIAIYVAFLFADLQENKFIYILPMLILAVCDPMAAILGTNITTHKGRIKIFGKKFKKTWLGSGLFLLIGFVISIIALCFHRGVFDFKAFWLAMLLSVVTMVAELVSWRGSDNFSIPLSAAIILVIFL